MRIPEKGIVYKTSRIAYMHNYILVVLLLVLFFLTTPFFNIQFSLLPTTIEQLTSTMLVFLFVLFIVFLIEEPIIERIFRHYIVTSHEVVKIEGLIRKKRITIPFQSVVNVKNYKGILGRIFNFGNIQINASNLEIIMKGMRNPDEIQRIIENKISGVRGGRRLQRAVDNLNKVS